MGLNIGGAPVNTDFGNLRWKPDDTRPNVAWILDDASEIAWGAFYGVFMGKGQFNASWVGAGVGKGDAADKIAKELGLIGSKVQGRTASMNAWVHVAVKNSDGSYSVKLWQVSKGNHGIINGWAQDGVDLAGYPITVTKTGGKWVLQPSVGAKNKPLTGVELDELRAQRMTEEDMLKMLGAGTEDEIKAELIRRSGGTNWNDVRAIVGLPPVELGGEYEEYE